MTFAEIQQAVGANPALLTEIAQGFGKEIIPIITGSDDLVKEVVPKLSSRGFIVRSADEEKSYLSSYLQRNDIRDSIVSPAIKDLHDRYDNDIFELTGERKGANEKTYDFLKRKITEIKASKIEDPVLKEQLTTLQRSLEDKEKTHKRTVEEIESKYFGREIDLNVSLALDKVNIAVPSQLKTDDEIQTYVNSQKSMMKRDFISSLTAKKDNDGNIVFYEGDKQLISNTDGKPLKASDIISQRYGFYIAKDSGRQQGGAGSGGNGGTSTFTTKEEVFKHLEGKGFKPLTKAFNDEALKIINEHKITK